ncbi:MAG: Coenzyme F420 hydrogenase/dehydrogenase, beta subunit C-terminal domain [Promethearchaeota archaeon]
MVDFESEMKQLARKLLTSKTVDKIIGYQQCSSTKETIPLIINDPTLVDNLVWNSLCDINLARYVDRADKQSKIGIIAKGCVSRALIQLIYEKQINRDNIYIIGLNCGGMVDQRRIKEEVGNKEILEWEETEKEIVVKGKGFEKSFAKDEYMNYLCKVCKFPVPPIYDELIGGDKPKETINKNYEDIEEFEGKSPDEKWEYFSNELKNCIRCYACRQACPLCYCEECFCDQSQPVWFGKSTELSDTIIFHLVRSMHLTGRCVACGDCNTVCPVGIDLIPLTRKLEKIVKERFNFTVGLDLEKVPPLSDFRMDDQEEFMVEED